MGLTLTPRTISRTSSPQLSTQMVKADLNALL